MLYYSRRRKGNKLFSYLIREMKVSFTNFPIDLVLCMVWSFIIIPVALFNLINPIRILLGIPFMLFIPGYVLLSALFPFKRQGESLSVIEKIGLSLGTSVAIVPLFGLALNFSPGGIRLQSLLFVLGLFIFSVGFIALYRWFKTLPKERFCVCLNILPLKSNNRVNGLLTSILVILIIISILLLFYVIVIPKTGEKFTEFYILDSNRKADEYPQNLSVGEMSSVILGITNHEYRDVSYTIEIWLVNETMEYNISESRNITLIKNIWFIDKITILLNHTQVNLEPKQVPQWEYNFSFSFDKVGNFKLAFFLFTTPSENYIQYEDYKDKAEELINSAYRYLHLWVNVS